MRAIKQNNVTHTLTLSGASVSAILNAYLLRSRNKLTFCENEMNTMQTDTPTLLKPINLLTY